MIASVQERVKLRNGVEMPWLGLGLWKVKAEGEAERAIRAAIQTGYRSIDTAKA